MSDYEGAVRGMLFDDSMYTELKDEIIEAVSERLQYYLASETLDAMFSEDGMSWAMIESELTQTAVDVLKDFVGEEN